VDVEYEVASLPEKETPLGDGSLSSDTDVSFTCFQKQFVWLIADCQSRFLVAQKHLLNVCRGLLIVFLSTAIVMRALPHIQQEFGVHISPAVQPTLLHSRLSDC
jgi:hypothetical protein